MVADGLLMISYFIYVLFCCRSYSCCCFFVYVADCSFFQEWFLMGWKEKCGIFLDF